MQPKEFFIEKLGEVVDLTKHIRIADLGSGQSRNFLPLLKKYPHITYVGIEPSRGDAEVARGLLKEFPNTKIYNQHAYEPLAGEEKFDLCISLSVLEHVKRLEPFLKSSVDMAKTGGLILHRYDLGHVLHSSSLKERLHVFLGNNTPFLLPQSKFVQYVDCDEVCRILEKDGAVVTDITYYQMPDHKQFLKLFQADTKEKKKLARDILEWEDSVSPYVREFSLEQREKLFPSVCVWARKN